MEKKFKKHVSQLRKRFQIKKKTVLQFKKPVSQVKMIFDAHFTHCVPEKWQNQKFQNKGDLRNVSKYRIKHKVKVSFTKEVSL